MTRTQTLKRTLAGATSLLAFTLAGGAFAQAMQFDIDAQPLNTALMEFGEQSGIDVAAPREVLNGKTSPAVRGEMEPEVALDKILAGSGLKSNELPTGAYTITLAGASLGEGSSEARPFRVAALAQEDDVREVDERQDLEENTKRDTVIVTGTRLKGIAPESSPVLVLDRDDIDKSGFNTVEDFFRTVTQSSGFGISDENFVSGDASGQTVNEQGSSLNLRGLGNRATLTLLNGQRLAPAGLSGQTVDVSLIPLSAVERIEILTVGASAIYGSDAVGGVVNFVLRDDFDGLETNLRFGTATSGDGDEFEATQTIGKAWNSGNAMVTYQYRSEDEVRAGDRDFVVDIPDESFFLPATESHSVFGAFDQQLTDQLSFGFTGLYTNRDSRRDNINQAGLRSFNTAEAETFLLGAELVYEIGTDWEATLSGTLSRNDSVANSVREDDSFFRLATSQGRSREATLSIAGSPLSLPAGDVNIAFGGQYRYQDFGIGIDFINRSIAFEEDSLDSYAAFAEALVPIVSEQNRLPGIERLEINAAVRYEDYGGSVGDTANPMLGLLWSPIKDIAFRATYDTSFRAPLPSEANGTFVLFVFGDVDFLFTDQNDPSRGNGVPLLAAGLNPNIGPEESETFTVGLDFTPESVEGLKFEATYFSTNFSDRITAPSPFISAIGDPAFEPFVIRNPDPATVQELLDSAESFSDSRQFFEPDPQPPILTPSDFSLISDNRVTNLTRTETSGIDFNGTYAFQAGEHGFNFTFNATYLFEFNDTLVEGADEVERLDTVFNPLDFRARAGAAWSYKGITSNIFVNYTDGYDDIRFDPVRSVDSFTTVDLNVSYDFGSNRGGLLSDTRLSLNVTNLFDEDPPFVSLSGSRGFAYDSVNASGRGRFIAATIRKAW